MYDSWPSGSPCSLVASPLYAAIVESWRSLTRRQSLGDEQTVNMLGTLMRSLASSRSE
jgi:hypothetical protein